MGVCRVMRIATVVVGSLAALALQPAAAKAAEADQQTYGDLNQGSLKFGLALYKRLLTGEDENVFISPLSIVGAFGPLRMGATGETRAAIDNVLGLGSGGPDVDRRLGKLMRVLQRDKDGVTLTIADALWVGKTAKLKSDYLKSVTATYDAAIEPIDFSNREAASNRINGWAKEQTRGRIPAVVSPQTFSDDTRLVVTNAVYLLADWSDPFDKRDTQQKPFATAKGAKTVPLMHQLMSAHYLSTPSFQAVDLPYRDNRLAMTVFLPRSPDGLERFEKSLTVDKLQDWLKRLDADDWGSVDVFLPALELDESYQLAKPLIDLGLENAFSLDAKFDVMSEEPLGIGTVVQKTFLKVDEKGTEAAAVTAVEAVVITGTRKPPPPPPVFRADHPFFLLIRDRSNGAVLFMGRVGDPTAKGS